MRAKWKTMPAPAAVLAAVLAAGLLYIAPHVLALEPAGQPWLEETLFLGEAVPSRVGGASLRELLLREFGEEGELECWWVGPQGRVGLDELSRQRPREETDYQISAVLRRKGQSDRWLHLCYRVRVVSGSVRVRADGPCAVAGETVLFRLEGSGMCLYQAAAPEVGPQGGPRVLAAEFTGLPFGVYTVTAVGSSQEPEQEECYIGVCRENDTVDPGRCESIAEFTLGEGHEVAVGESFRLGVGT